MYFIMFTLNDFFKYYNKNYHFLSLIHFFQKSLLENKICAIVIRLMKKNVSDIIKKLVAITGLLI